MINPSRYAIAASIASASLSASFIRRRPSEKRTAGDCRAALFFRTETALTRSRAAPRLIHRQSS
jgi:hypothetical protein